MNESYIEYQTILNFYQSLRSTLEAVNYELKSRPMDIQLQADQRRVKADLKTLWLLIEKISPVILMQIETKHGIKFEFLGVDTRKKNGKIITPDGQQG